MKITKLKEKMKNTKGFSLLEVLLAIVILGLVAAPILQIFVTSAHINNNSRELMAATDVATMTMEHITSMKMDGGAGSARTYFTQAGTKTRIPGVPYSAQSYKLADSYSSYTGFKGNTTPANANVEDDDPAVYYAGTSDGSNFGLMMNEVTYNGYIFDVLVWCEKSADASKFYTYDVTVEVYAINSEVVEVSGGGTDTVYSRYQERLIVMNGAVANK